MATASTSANAWLEENYTNESLQYQTLKKFPTLSMCRKRANTDFGPEGLRGRYHYRPYISAGAGSDSPDLATAIKQANVNQFGQSGAFELPPVSHYYVHSTPGLTWAQMEGASFISGMKKMVRDSNLGMNVALSRQLFGTGVDVVGQVAAITTTSVSNDTITLTNIIDARNFQNKAKFIDVKLTNTVGAARTRGTALITAGTGMQVQSVVRETGNLVFAQSVTDAANGIPGLSVGDYIFNAGSSTAGIMAGIGAWNPVGGVTNVNDSFYNVARFGQSCLYGYSKDGTGGTSLSSIIKDALTEGRSAIDADPDVCAMNYAQYNKLEKGLSPADRYTSNGMIEEKVVAALNGGEDLIVPGIRIGDVFCYQDNSVPNGILQMYKEEELELYQLKDGFSPWDYDGSPIIRDMTTPSDAVMAWFASYHQLAVNPQNCIVVTVDPA